jgi:AcrR family transcriptional regulator
MAHCVIFGPTARRFNLKEGISMAKSLTTRKQEFVRDSIFDAAIELFVRKGFLQTNVDDVAQAAGVSRRSFFRYFSTKDHVLAHNIMKYGDVLVSAIGASPAESSAFEVVHDAVLAGLRFATSDPRTPQIMQITAQNLSIRQAHRSRTVEVEIRLCAAFAARTRNETKDDVRPRMLALLTLMLVDLTLMSWLKGGFEDWLAASNDVMAQLSRVLCEPNGPLDQQRIRGAN